MLGSELSQVMYTYRIAHVMAVWMGVRWESIYHRWMDGVDEMGVEYSQSRRRCGVVHEAVMS